MGIGKLKNTFTSAAGWGWKKLSGASSAFNNKINNIASGAKNKAKSAYEWINKKASGAVDKAKSAYNWADNKTGGKLTEGLKQHGGDVLKSIGGLAGSFGGPIGSAIGAGLGALGNHLNNKYQAGKQSTNEHPSAAVPSASFAVEAMQPNIMNQNFNFNRTVAQKRAARKQN